MGYFLPIGISLESLTSWLGRGAIPAPSFFGEQMRKLLTLLPGATDATSLYRGAGPLHSLARKLKDFELTINPNVTWETIRSHDALFVQRPHLKKYLKVIEMAQAQNKLVWVDYDDDLYSVPFSNPTHALYGNPETMNTITACLCKAEVVTVSTPALRDKLALIMENVGKAKQEMTGLNLDTKKIRVIPNAYDDAVLGGLEPLRWPQNKLVMWRGSHTHDKDLMTFTPAMTRVLKNHLDWTYNFVGSPFWHTIEEMEAVPGCKPNNVIIVPTLDPIDFAQYLAQARPALMIVPLDDSPFNRAKSNIAWVEAAHAGAVALAPDWPEWQRPGVINYKGVEDFEQKYDKFLRGEFDGLALANASRAWIKENLLLSRVNEGREFILRQIMG